MHDPRFHTQRLSDEERECIILEHLPQVRLLARRIHGRLPDNVSLDDLVSTGVVGLIAAVDRFDPSRHLHLRTYAGHKIKGGILDSLRKLDWAPRQRRQRAKKIKAAIDALEQRLHRAPMEHEVAAELNINLDRYREWQVSAHALNQASLDEVESDAGEQRGQLRFISADASELPSALHERRELQRVLATAISGLPEIHQTVISLYYNHELTSKEIAKIVGVHESLVSRLRTRAIRQLRACMAKLWPTGGRGLPH